MTPTQKNVFQLLLSGGTIAKIGNQYRVRTEQAVPVMTISFRTMYRINRSGCLRKREGLLVLDKRKVRQLHGNDWLKREYKVQQLKATTCENSK